MVAITSLFYVEGALDIDDALLSKEATEFADQLYKAAAALHAGEGRRPVENDGRSSLNGFVGICKVSNGAVN